MAKIDKEQVKANVTKALVAQFSYDYTWLDLLDDAGLTPAELAWAKKHLDYGVKEV